MVFFAYVDPVFVDEPGVPPGEVGGKMTAYSAGFFFFWIVAALASAVTLLLVRSDRPGPANKADQTRSEK